MSKVSLTNLVNLTNQTTAVNAINANNAAITTAMDKTLSRDGTTPNQMTATLDMNSNRIINLPTAISTSEPVPLGQMVAALVAGGNINIGATTVPVSAAMQPVVAGTIANAKTLLQVPTPYVDATLYGVTANGITDDTAALQAAITAADGREVFLPAGTIVLTSQVSYITSLLFAAGLKLRGSGTNKTYIDNRVANNSCIYAASTGTGFQLGGWIKDLTIMTTTNPVNSHGIEHKACWMYTVENVFVTALSGDGMRVTCNIGDADAGNEMKYKNCRIEHCNIGFNCNFTFGVTQPSYMKFEDVFFHFNGIGCRWIGLSGTMFNCAFTQHTNVGLQIANNGSSNAQFTCIQTGFENNAKAIEIQSLQGGTFIETELAGSNVITPSTQAVQITAGAGVRFSDTRVRIGSTPHTLWTFGPTAFYNVIENSFYQTYDVAGQTRYVLDPAAYGNRLDDSTDTIVSGRSNGIVSITCVNGVNNDVVVPIEGAMYTIGGTSAPFSVTGFTNGFLGRRLTLINSGQTLTLTPATGTATNQIVTDALAPVVINNGGSCVLVYGTDSRWHLVGKG